MSQIDVFHAKIMHTVLYESLGWLHAIIYMHSPWQYKKDYIISKGDILQIVLIQPYRRSLLSWLLPMKIRFKFQIATNRLECLGNFPKTAEYALPWARPLHPPEISAKTPAKSLRTRRSA
jgi:hypothetical protein